MTRHALLPIESLRVHLGALVADYAEKLGVERRADEAGSHDDLRQILMKRGYPQHAAVFEFEERYGGVLVPDYGTRSRDPWLIAASHFVGPFFAS
jgi:hypothetical protein